MLRKVHIEKMSHAITGALSKTRAPSVSAEQVVLKVADILTQNMEAERALDEEAHKLLEKHRRAAGMEMDEQKAFQMIKRQLARQKNFVL